MRICLTLPDGGLASLVGALANREYLWRLIDRAEEDSTERDDLYDDLSVIDQDIADHVSACIAKALKRDVARIADQLERGEA